MSIELIGGTAGSFIFLFVVLFLFKPKVKICNFVCKRKNTNPQQFAFKFVNHSFFSAHDIAIELHKIRKVPIENGNVNNIYTQITLIKGHISHIAGRKFKWNRVANNPHCIVVSSIENINGILADEMNGIVLKVSLKHGLTGLAKVFEKEYFNEDDIKDGRFIPGTRFGYI